MIFDIFWLVGLFNNFNSASLNQSTFDLAFSCKLYFTQKIKPYKKPFTGPNTIYHNDFLKGHHKLKSNLQFLSIFCLVHPSSCFNEINFDLVCILQEGPIKKYILNQCLNQNHNQNHYSSLIIYSFQIWTKYENWMKTCLSLESINFNFCWIYNTSQKFVAIDNSNWG